MHLLVTMHILTPIFALVVLYSRISLRTLTLSVPEWHIILSSSCVRARAYFTKAMPACLQRGDMPEGHLRMYELRCTLKLRMK